MRRSNTNSIERIRKSLESLGYSVNAHAEKIFRGDEHSVSCLKPAKRSDLREFTPLSGTLFELWYPRLFQGKVHGQIANAYFKLFGTQACLISNPVVWRGILGGIREPIFVDIEGKVRTGFISFGQHYVFPTLRAYLSEPDNSFRLVGVDDPEGNYENDETRFVTMYREARPTILKFYNRVLWSLSWVPGTEIDMGEDI